MSLSVGVDVPRPAPRWGPVAPLHRARNGVGGGFLTTGMSSAAAASTADRIGGLEPSILPATRPRGHALACPHGRTALPHPRRPAVQSASIGHEPRGSLDVTSCSACGADNREGRRFCAACASPLPLACPACGGRNEPGEAFCGDCAAPLGGTAAALPAPRAPITPPPVAERRHVSVLFADLVGFTSFAEERDAEEVRDTLTRYSELASTVIGRHGGTAEKFIGDAVMAVWGAPIAHEDDAERAVRAGLELADAVRSLGPSMQVRVGVLTGEAAVTIGAVGQGMVAGDLVNAASRLQSAAPPGAVLVGEATARAASAAIVFEAAGEQTLRGKAAPVPAWRALRVVAERGGRNRSAALESPFVGRADELRLLKDLFHATIRERRPRHVSVTGQAGIGKTRLAWEFLKYADGLVEDTLWHEGRCPAYGDGITFWALGEMVRARAGLLETDDEATTRARIGATVAAYVPDPDERRWIEPALLALLGVETGAAGTEQLFAAWRTFFERLAAVAPVVMVFEDLQHADAGLLDFIDHLFEWSRGVPIYVLTLARPELLERRPGWGAGRRSFTSLQLEPLSRAAMRELLGGLVPGLPEAAVRTIVERADGVPLYAVETIRMLLADGRLVASDGAYRPAGDLAAIAVPETLTELVAARLDALEAPDRALLLDAAVLGQSFTTAALAAVSGIAEPALGRRLRGLVRRELLALETDPRSPERGQYAFVQSLVREVAYNTLARADRKRRHLAAARYFETLGSDELAGAVAGHFLAAHRNAPWGPEADAVAAQARIALRVAAERAAGVGSHDQAVAFLEQALVVTTDPAEEAELLEGAGKSASAAAHPDRAEAFLRRAIEVWRALGDGGAIARATAALASAMIDAYRYDAAVDLLEPAVAEFPDPATDAAVVALHGQLARAYMLRDDHRRAIEVADRGLEAAERLDIVEIVADTLVTKGTALGALGRAYEGLGVIEAGRKLAEANGLETVALRALLNLSGDQMDDDPRMSLEASRAALAKARRLGDRGSLSGILNNLRSACFRLGDWDAALAELESALGEDFDPLDQAKLLACTLDIRNARGEPTASEHAAVEALLERGPEHYRSVNRWCRIWEAYPAGRLDAVRALCHEEVAEFGRRADDVPAFAARAALWMRDAEGARADLATLEAIGRHGRAIKTDRLSIRAGLAALDGRPAEALALYRDALRAWRELGLVWDEALCGIDMATVLDPSTPEVRAAAERGREILVRLKAKPFIERLDAATAADRHRADGLRPTAGVVGVRP
jgi:class 3 adenylate cyclase/tetratricopeptide (TPR) repeat protein